MRVFEGVLLWVLLQQSSDYGSVYILSRIRYHENHIQ